MLTNQWIEFQHPADLPINCLQDRPLPSTPPNSLNLGLQLFLHSRSIMASKFASSWLLTSAKCHSVQKPYANLPDTPVALASVSKYFQMLPAPPGALQSALRLCKSILTCSWKHLHWWRSIQDAMRFDYSNTRIVELLRPLRRSAGDFESSWDICTSSVGDLVPYSHTSGS